MASLYFNSQQISTVKSIDHTSNTNNNNEGNGNIECTKLKPRMQCQPIKYEWTVERIAEQHLTKSEISDAKYSRNNGNLSIMYYHEW